MKQIISVPDDEIKNLPQNCYPHLTSVYRTPENNLIAIYELKHLREGEEVTVVPLELEVPHKLEVEYFLIVGESLKNKEIKSFSSIKDKVKNAECVYGEDMRSCKDKFLVALNNFSFLNLQWFKHNVNPLFGGSLLLAGVFGFFALKQQVVNTVGQVFNKTTRPS